MGGAAVLLLCALAVLLQVPAHGAAAVAEQAEKGARILVVISMQAPSHHIVFAALTRALADRGHHITFVTPLDDTNKVLPTKNHRIVSVHSAEEAAFLRQAVAKFMQGTKSDVFTTMLNFLNWGPTMARGLLTHPNFKAEILDKPGQRFDLIITEAFFIQEAMVALGHRFDAPVVALNPFGAAAQMSSWTGNPVNPAWVTNPVLGNSDRMTFSERLINSLFYTFTMATYHLYQMPRQQAVADDVFPDAPPLADMLRSRLVLTLLNSHYTLGYPAPLPPNTVEVGGMHIADKPKALPKDLQDFMDGAKEGVVYFSMGSNLRMEFLPHEKLLAIFNSLGAIKERVLLKWDGPTPEKVSPNIKMIKWAPQADVLAHPNLRAFVTHGGLLSTQESVYHGVPLVGIPVFADQSFNMKLATAKGFCAQVDYSELTEEALTKALREILGNPKYKEAAGRLSRLFRAKPDRPVDKAVFWVEHVLAHGGDHLRPSSVHLPLYQLLLLDVLAAVLAAVVVLFLLVKGLFKAVCWACCGTKAPKAAVTAAKKAKKTN